MHVVSNKHNLTSKDSQTVSSYGEYGYGILFIIVEEPDLLVYWTLLLRITNQVPFHKNDIMVCSSRQTLELMYFNNGQTKKKKE